jgi:hypothetical protein
LLFAEGIPASAQSPPGNLSPTQFDLVCAMVSGAEMGASQNAKDVPRRNMYTTLFSYYLGRLSGRDDTKDWNGIVRGRVAELQQAARSPEMLERCSNFYMSKIE